MVAYSFLLTVGVNNLNSCIGKETGWHYITRDWRKISLKSTLRSADGSSVMITAEQLKLILQGIVLNSVVKRKRYIHYNRLSTVGK
jgi:site-specific recombinase